MYVTLSGTADELDAAGFPPILTPLIDPRVRGNASDGNAIPSEIDVDVATSIGLPSAAPYLPTEVTGSIPLTVTLAGGEIESLTFPLNQLAEEVTPLLTEAPEAIRTAVAKLNQPLLDVRVRFTDIGEPAGISQPSPEEVVDPGFTMALGASVEETVAAHEQKLRKSGESLDLHIPDPCKVGTSM